MFKNLFNLGKQKTQPQACTPTTPRRDSGVNGTLASGGYTVRKKDVGKLHIAASKGDVAKVQWLLLLKKQGMNETDKLNRTPLHLASANGYPDVVSLLVERNCNLNVCDSDNRTPLIKAVQCQQEECATILLSHGADPSVVDTRSNTALHYSALGHNTAIAAKLLENKADIEAKNQDGYTPFLLAVRTENEKMVEFFLNNGANVNACDNSKRTALMIALTFGNKPTNIISLMIQYNVDLSCEDEFEWTAKNYANISIVDVNRELFLQHETRQLNQLPLAKNSSPDENSDIAFTLGGPALDKEDTKNKKIPEGVGGPENRESGLNVQKKSGSILLGGWRKSSLEHGDKSDNEGMHSMKWISARNIVSIGVTEPDSGMLMEHITDRHQMLEEDLFVSTEPCHL
ncbi:ankyrin repeat domain-containing protein 7-like [Gracilinanus agilis]|uniref:ankyrin repeat domain-containing protein 7-like n=1 Tax=Gracilinanus agilis TaxID=191870 RepID=UPI001CFDFA7E|nr:ankyrin repeat domain-containing protein 7-like [Gracilinanus agilis]